MPDPRQTLENLIRIANEARALAIVWHVVLAAVILRVVMGWRPSNRFAGVLLVVPLASVSAVGFAFGNPFNGTIFAVLAVVLAGLSLLRPSTARVARAPHWAELVGTAMISFGWIYPHFLVVSSPIEYFVAAPVGILPCPTLAVVVGFAISWRGMRSPAWSWTLAAVSAFYAIYGVAQLGVLMDALLMGGAVALVVVASHAYRTRFEQLRERPV